MSGGAGISDAESQRLRAYIIGAGAPASPPHRWTGISSIVKGLWCAWAVERAWEEASRRLNAAYLADARHRTRLATGLEPASGVEPPELGQWTGEGQTSDGQRFIRHADGSTTFL